MALASEHRQVLADLNPRRACRNGPKLAADFGGGIGLQVEAVELRKATRKKDVNDCAGVRRGPLRVGGNGTDERLTHQSGTQAADTDRERLAAGHDVWHRGPPPRPHGRPIGLSEISITLNDVLP